MIKFDRVSKRYDDGKDALSQVSFELQQGEMAFLTGRSGAGKSSLLKLITRVEQPSQGQVFVAGRNLNRLPRRQDNATAARRLGCLARPQLSQ